MRETTEKGHIQPLVTYGHSFQETNGFDPIEFLFHQKSKIWDKGF